MNLIKTRECDGSCCRQSPRFPNESGDDCIYHDIKGCILQRGESPVPEDKKEWFERTCVEWPHNMPGRDTGNCCWQWVDE